MHFKVRSALSEENVRGNRGTVPEKRYSKPGTYRVLFYRTNFPQKIRQVWVLGEDNIRWFVMVVERKRDIGKGEIRVDISRVLTPLGPACDSAHRAPPRWDQSYNRLNIIDVVQPT